jgi:hypothetical protein
VSGWPQWSPDGTEIALDTESYNTNLSAPYLLVAHLVSRRPTKPLPVVSSQPGNWAPGPLSYHGAIAAEGTVILHGLAAGTATVTYAGGGVASGDYNVIYRNYSDNGRDFVNGTNSVTSVSIPTGPTTIHTNLTMTGAHHGYSHIDLTFSGSDRIPVTVSGTAVTSYDGTTVSGPPHTPQPCPQSLPRAPKLKLHARVVRKHGRRLLLVTVTASIAGAGANEAAFDTRPVYDATVRLDRRRATTNNAGIATLRIPRRRRRTLRITASAGDTFAATSGTLRLR